MDNGNAVDLYQMYCNITDETETENVFFLIRKESTKMKSDYHSKFMDKKVLTHTDMDTILEMGKLLFIYRTCAIISRGLYFFTPFFTVANIVEQLILQSG